MGNKGSSNPSDNSNNSQSYEDKLKRSNEEIRLLRERKFQESQAIAETQEKEEQKDIKSQEIAKKLPQMSKKIEEPAIKTQLDQKFVEKPREIEKKLEIPQMKPEDLEQKYLEETFLQPASPFSQKLLRIYEVLPEKTEANAMKFEDLDEFLDTILRSPLQKFFENHEEKLDYLYNSWLRSSNSRLVSEKSLGNLRENLQKKLFSYMISFVLTPIAYEIEEEDEKLCDIFEQTHKIKNKFHELLVKDLNEEFIEAFFENLFKETNEVDIIDILESLLKRVFKAFSATTLEKTRPLVTNLSFLDILLRNPKNLEFFCEKSAVFCDRISLKTGADIEKRNIFGVFLSSLSILPSPTNKIFELFFKGAEKQSRQVIEKNIANVREKINEPIVSLFKLLEFLIKKGKKHRIIEFFWLIIAKNKEKTKMMNMNSYLNSSDGFLVNLTRVLMLFSVPFCENEEKILAKLDKIDSKFANYQANPNFQSLQPFNLEVYSQNIEENCESSAHFISEIYFLATYFLHLNQKLYKNLLEFQIKLSKLHKNNPNSPELSQLISHKFTYDAFLLDPLLIDNYLRLFSLTSLLSFSYLQCKYDQNTEKYLSKNLDIFELPCPKALARLPSFLAEDMYEYLLCLIQMSPETLAKKLKYVGFCCDFMLLMIGNRNLLNNPHIRAKFLTILSIFVPDYSRNASVFDQFQGILVEREFFREKLIEGLFEIFVDVEKTGSNNQFYEKFSYRHAACKIFSYVLSESIQKRFDFRGKFKEFLSKNRAKFLHFMFLLLNDLIYLLDDSLNRLKEIKAHEDNEANLSSLNPQEKLEKLRIYEENKRVASTFLLFLNSYYENLDFFSSLGSDVLILEEIREKLVNNLNYTVEALNGQNAMALKTKNMKKLHFDPKHILKSIINLYLNLSHHEIFLETIIKDERSFNEKTFDKTIRILTRENLLDPEEIEHFKKMLEKLVAMKAEMKRNEEALGEIPEEFQDPLIMDLMNDPVLLPTSNMIVDRMTIIKHLLSDPTDPFNRKPLSKEMLVPQEELKRRIMEFKKEKLNKK